MVVKLKPAIKSYLWGGTKLKSEWRKDGGQNISESWELSFHGDGPSEIASGNFAGKRLCDVVTRADWGANCEQFDFFPVLNKLIDAALPLSVQVHPSDAYALKNEGQYGKTEMWYILGAEEGAFIYLGFNCDITESRFSDAIQSGDICEYLNRVPVAAGQTYFIPSGTVHAIGGGVTLFEIQQNSSLTYRVYDFDRVGKDGLKRELHIEKAKAVASLTATKAPDPARGELLGRCKYFSAYRFRGARALGRKDSFVSVTVIDGSIVLDGVVLEKGQTAFASAGEPAVVSGDGEYIVTCVEK